MNDMPVPIYSYIALFLLGLIPTLIKSTQADIVTIGLARLVIAVVLYSFYVLVRRKKISFTRENFLPCLAIGTAFGLHWLCYFLSIRLSTVAVATLCMATSGLMMLVLSRWHLHEPLHRQDILALVITIFGSLLVVPNYNFGDRSFWGFAVGLLNALLFAIAATLQRYHAERIPNHTRTFAQYFFALPVFLILWPKTHWQLSRNDFAILIALGVFCTVIAHTLWIKTLELLPAKKAAVLYYLSTLFAVVIAAIVLHEVPSVRVVIGGVLILAGNVLALIQKTSSSESLKS